MLRFLRVNNMLRFKGSLKSLSQQISGVSNDFFLLIFTNLCQTWFSKVSNQLLEKLICLLPQEKQIPYQHQMILSALKVAKTPLHIMTLEEHSAKKNSPLLKGDILF